MNACFGSKSDFIERMGTDGADAIGIGNPMTESADMVRTSIIPNLLASEAESAHAVYPHCIFKIGKVAVKDPSLDGPRFIPGRASALNVGGPRIAMIGEIHPQRLTNWGIEMPCAVAELNLDFMRGV
jgi:phenylalanyl-tRNA synthetase beta chain